MGVGQAVGGSVRLSMSRDVLTSHWLAFDVGDERREEGQEGDRGRGKGGRGRGRGG